MISTRNLSAMPDLDAFVGLTRSLAMLDSILSPEWQYRYYSFNSQWADGEMMASMRNGCGDHWFALLSQSGIGMVGLAHEAPMFRVGDPWPGIFGSVPEAFARVVAEPAFDTTNTTFFIWRGRDDERWHVGDVKYAEGEDPDGSAELLRILDGDPSTYRDWAESYYELSVDLEAVQAIYAHRALTEDLVRALNPSLGLTDLEGDMQEIGYRDAA